MNSIRVPRSVMLLACTAALLASVGTQAQTRRFIGSAAPVAGPSMAARTAPPPSGTLPNPAGLTSQFPAGLPPLAANPASLPDPTQPSTSSTGAAVVDPSLPQTAVMGAGRGGGSRPVYVIPGSYTAVQIAGSFIGADANRDGELTPAEARRLTIAPFSFEEMDANHDGVVTRSEYEDSLR